MSPERHPSHDGGDGDSEGGGGAIIGVHVTVETSSPKSSPTTTAQLDAAPSAGSSMVLSSMPVEANQLILQQHLAHQPQPQQQHHIITTSNTNQNHNSNSNGSAISAANSGSSSNHSIIINNNTSFKNHNNNIIISGSGVSGGNSNNHTYTINLSSSHNGHAVIANGGAVPIQSYAPIVSTNNSSGSIAASGGNHSHHHLGGQQFHHLHPAPNGTTIINPNMTTVHSNGLTTATTTVMASSAVPAPSPLASGPTSKLVVLQQGHLGENYITTTDGMNGVGNIVLLATEQMDMSGTEHDIINNNVVITSSSNCYSHNGLIGSSASSTTNSANHPHQYTIRNGTASSTATVLTSNGVNGVVVNADEELTPLTWLHDKNLLKGINLSKVPVSSPDSPRQAGGHLSPTSDFVEDSSVSEDNTSSANSSSEQSIGVYCTETSHPIGRPLPITASTHHHTFQLSNGGHKTITTINGDTIIEYPIITTEEKELKSPSSTVSCASSSSSSSTSSSLYSSSPSPNPASALTSQNGNSSGASTPHQHFHKKYLREEHVKQLKQVSNSYVTPIKQHTSTIKYEEGELCEEREERHYPQAPIKNGYNSGEEYSGGMYGGSMKPPSPPISPQQLNGTGSIPSVHTLAQQTPSSPQPSPVCNGGQQQSKLSPPKAKHPTNLPYDPQVHVHSKPPFSFSSLIFMAIENCQQKALPVKEIYAWIVQHFPYFKTAPTGWKNSVRHNLSLNKCFQKVEKAANLGKGSLWMVEPQYRPNLIQALSRSPFHTGSGIDKTTYKAMQQQAQQQAQQHQQQPHQRSTDSPTSSIGSSYSKDNFPYLASRLTPVDPQNGVHLHHLHHQQHPDLDGDDFSRSSTPIDFDGGDLPHHSAAPGTYHVTYHHHVGGGGGSAGGGGVGAMASPTGAIPNGYATSGPVGTPVHVTNGASLPIGETPSRRDWSADTIDDVNAATAMLALKHGPKIFSDGGFQNGTPPVITTSPSEDHTYSAGGSILPTTVSGRSSQNNSDNNSNGTLSDAAYESSEESQNMPASEELEEQRRQAGVDALLNLAGITNYSPSTIQSISTSLKRPASSMYEADRESPYHHQQQRLESTPPSGYSIVVQQQQQQQQQQPYRGYYTPDDLSQYSSPSPPKKSKSSSSRMLKKFKKKASWVR